MSDAAHRYAFRRLGEADMPLVAGWLKEPHVTRWWGNPADALKEIEGQLTSDTVKPFIILIDERPVGYMQSYDIHAEEDHPYRDQPAGSIGIDLSIGEPGLIGKGHGPQIIDAFVKRLFADGVPRVVIDPDPANAAAIRAYSKAGFRFVDERTSIYGPAVIMARDAEDLTRTP
jgi:aminoglycoside 6'-N-acetyltransferase